LQNFTKSRRETPRARNAAGNGFLFDFIGSLPTTSGHLRTVLNFFSLMSKPFVRFAPLEEAEVSHSRHIYL
jgi:hypothetical protein